MDTTEVQVGSTITNGSSALRITERIEKDPRWATSGWRGMVIPLDEFGGNAGMTEFLADYLLTSWHHVPFEWRQLVGGGIEERYVWAPGWWRLEREVRVNFPRKMCTEAARFSHEMGHEWQETGIETGNPLVKYSQWWRCEVRQIEPVPVDCRSEPLTERRWRP